MKEFNCFWSQGCKNKRICCCFCDQQDCEWRCNDDPKKCSYKSFVYENYKKDELMNEASQFKIEESKGRSHNEIVDNNLRRKIKEYRLNNHLKIEAFANMVGIDRQTFQRVLSDLPIVKLRTATYEKIKEFVKNI